MPTADRQHLAPLAIRCFLQQTLHERELLILDDGTEPLRPLVPDDARIRYWHFAPRRSVGAKRNLGAELAHGQILCNWDDDDWSHPLRLQTQVERLLQSGKQVTGFKATVYFNEADGYFYHNPGPGAVAMVSGTSQMYRRTWWRAHPYPEVLEKGEDTAFAIAAADAGQLAIAEPGHMLVARAHPASTCRLDFSKLQRIHREEIPARFFADYLEACQA